MYYYTFFGIIAVLLVWAIGSYLVIRNLEEPKFTVLEKRDGYEIREYAPYIVAETKVSGTYSRGLNQGFGAIADYIFGNNTTKTSIAMTAPVLQEESEAIAMTVPVINTLEENRTVSFVLPSKYTMDTLPLPNNPAVELREISARKVAVLSFTWYATGSRVDSKRAELEKKLFNDSEIIDGPAQVAQYNPPASFPFTLRNEIIIPIK
jgi:hypothetical protein